MLRHQIGHDLALVVVISNNQVLRHRRIGLDRADAVDAGHRSYDDHIVAFQQRPRRRMAHAVDLLVDLAFLLDIGVRAGDVGLGLVVVIVADEIFHGVFREIGLELGIELGGQRLIGREDDRRPLGFLDDFRHGEGLAGARRPQQNLVLVAILDALHQVTDRGRLVAGRFELGVHDEALSAFQFCLCVPVGRVQQG